jgi:zinc transport system substrate-binding protein
MLEYRVWRNEVYFYIDSTDQKLKSEHHPLSWISANRPESMMKIGLKLIGIFSIVLATWIASLNAAGKIVVFVSIAPQKYFVQQIGKELVDIQVMVQPGADPHTYEAKPKQMVAITKAKLYFAIGIEFEKARLGKISSANPEMKVVQTDQDIQKIAMAAPYHSDDEGQYEKGEHHAGTEYGRDDDHHSQGGLDPHIWLSPPLVMKQARTILTALQKIDPDHRAVYEANYKTFVSEIADLDNEIKSTFSGKRGLQFMVFHPAWGYFAHTYGLRQIPVEIEGKNPKPAQLKKLIIHAQENDIKVIFVQPQFSGRSAELIAREIGGHVVFADPLAEAWAANLRKVAQQIKDQLR